MMREPGFYWVKIDWGRTPGWKVGELVFDHRLGEKEKQRHWWIVGSDVDLDEDEIPHVGGRIVPPNTGE